MEQFMVYNRWGDVVHEAGEVEEVWDGTSMGGQYMCPDGVYTYRVVYRCLAAVHEKFGHVNLFR